MDQDRGKTYPFINNLLDHDLGLVDLGPSALEGDVDELTSTRSGSILRFGWHLDVNHMSGILDLVDLRTLRADNLAGSSREHLHDLLHLYASINNTVSTTSTNTLGKICTTRDFGLNLNMDFGTVLVEILSHTLANVLDDVDPAWSPVVCVDLINSQGVLVLLRIRSPSGVGRDNMIRCIITLKVSGNQLDDGDTVLETVGDTNRKVGADFEGITHVSLTVVDFDVLSLLTGNWRDGSVEVPSKASVDVVQDLASVLVRLCLCMSALVPIEPKSRVAP
ncbi:uncharacterized protein LY89DRAFT_286214 [Mollisia scopiformis]|uniref:Uncharacterized protein n=1 Tax=Mollisia scopiformis TaxID=149040 RepID=A0A132BBL8_MOLSC|nr:uncharacterized protein LY89DRAFT_286214 [Mollisia scopiformis]KUJ09399.1 hypothetical protein LY89DRAFT_286214 [Mollisia scopiformis]